MSKGKKILSLALAMAMAASMLLTGCGQKDDTSSSASASTEDPAGPVIGISWAYTDADDPYVVDEYAGYAAVIEEAGGVPVRLDQITTTAVKYDEDGTILDEYIDDTGMLLQEYADSVKAHDFSMTNVETVMEGIDGVFFIGGEDISPSLFATPVPVANKGEGINATRDISDYTLMAYCFEKDIPTLAACRGEQMMSIVSGCTFIQDLTDYYAAQGINDYAEVADTHRMAPGMENRTYARHDVDILEGSKWLGTIVGSDKLEQVSSWHHQAVDSVEGTNLTVVATGTINGLTVVEAVERQDMTFCLGVQFHPENDCVNALYAKNPDGVKCDLDTCLNFFKTFVQYAAQ